MGDNIQITGDTPGTTFSVAYSDAGIGTALGLAGNSFAPTGDPTWELFYLEDSTAVGTNVAWRNAGVQYEFDSSGQMTSNTQVVTLTNVSINGIPLEDIAINHGSSGITQFADINGNA